MIPISLSVLAQIGVCFNRFWSSDKLTGSQTRTQRTRGNGWFWSSDKLTGSQTESFNRFSNGWFWSSDKLTGSQTRKCISARQYKVLEQ